MNLMNEMNEQGTHIITFNQRESHDESNFDLIFYALQLHISEEGKEFSSEISRRFAGILVGNAEGL